MNQPPATRKCRVNGRIWGIYTNVTYTVGNPAMILKGDIWDDIIWDDDGFADDPELCGSCGGSGECDDLYWCPDNIYGCDCTPELCGTCNGEGYLY